MNGRFEEKLARIAFGDASPEEIAKIERKAENDPAAAKALAEFRKMKADLRKMADTPAHQLSNERLRDAILAQGLHPKPLKEAHSGTGAGWLWMPLAAALLGVAFVNYRHQPRTVNPRIVINGPAIPEPTISMSKFDLKANESKSTTYVAQVETKRAPLQAAADLYERSRYSQAWRGGHHRRKAAKVPEDSFPAWEDDRSNWQTNNLRSNPQAPKSVDQPTPTNTQVAENKAPSSPIVLIDSDPDSQTGAPGATEVGTASNVVIGG